MWLRSHYRSINVLVKSKEQNIELAPKTIQTELNYLEFQTQFYLAFEIKVVCDMDLIQKFGVIKTLTL